MKKAMLMMIAAGTMALGAAEKVWPENYWTESVTNLVTAATPTGTATASAQLNLGGGDTASTISSAYSQAIEARIKLMFASENGVADFSSFPPGTILRIR